MTKQELLDFLKTAKHGDYVDFKLNGVEIKGARIAEHVDGNRLRACFYLCHNGGQIDVEGGCPKDKFGYETVEFMVVEDHNKFDYIRLSEPLSTEKQLKERVDAAMVLLAEIEEFIKAHEKELKAKDLVYTVGLTCPNVDAYYSAYVGRGGAIIAGLAGEIAHFASNSENDEENKAILRMAIHALENFQP